MKVYSDAERELKQEENRLTVVRTLNQFLASICLSLCSTMCVYVCVCVCVLDSSPAQCRCAVDSFISGGSGLLRERGRGKGGGGEREGERLLL